MRTYIIVLSVALGHFRQSLPGNTHTEESDIIEQSIFICLFAAYKSRENILINKYSPKTSGKGSFRGIGIIRINL